MIRLLVFWFTKEFSGIFDLKMVNPILEELVSKENLHPCMKGSLFDNQDPCVKESLRCERTLLLSGPWWGCCSSSACFPGSTGTRCMRQLEDFTMRFINSISWEAFWSWKWLCLVLQGEEGLFTEKKIHFYCSQERQICIFCILHMLKFYRTHF